MLPTSVALRMADWAPYAVATAVVVLAVLMVCSIVVRRRAQREAVRALARLQLQHHRPPHPSVTTTRAPRERHPQRSVH